MMNEKTKNILLNVKSKIKQFFHDAFVFPMYILTHPIKGYEEFKTEKKARPYIAVFYALMMIVSSIVTATMSGFLVKPPTTETFNLGKTILLVLVPILIVAVGNWSITSLFNGKGKLYEILMVICYGLIPYIWLSIPATLVSNYLISEEVAFFTAIISLGVILSAFMIFMGLLVIHEYGLAKTIVTIIFTVVAIAVIIFIGILILTLFQQIYSFLDSVIREVILRLN